MRTSLRAAESRAGDRACAVRRGFSLIEILVVLAILALATAIIMPSTSRMLDQATSHAVFFEFQRQVSDLRREASRTGVVLRLVDPSIEPDDVAGERVAELREPWRYALAPALDIDGGGVCSSSTARLMNGERTVMVLRTEDGTCRFMRQAAVPSPGEETLPGSASR